MSKHPLLFFFLLAAVVAGALLLLPADQYAKIILTDPANDRVILATVIHEGNEASYTWTNSIFRIPVREVFILQDGSLIHGRLAGGWNRQGVKGDHLYPYHVERLSVLIIRSTAFPFSGLERRVL